MINILELECSKGWGGQEKRTARLINGLDKNRFKVYYGVFKESETYKKSAQIDAEILEIPIKQSYDIFALFKIIKIIKKYKIDIISTHSGKDAFIGALAGKITGTKTIRTRHLQTEIRSPYSYNLASKVVCVSQNVQSYLESVGVQKEKLETIYTGIDTNLFAPSSSTILKDMLGIGKDSILIGIVAVLRAAKRHAFLIEALKDFDNVHLAIIGSGVQMENLQALRENLDYKERIHLLGQRDDIPQLLPSLDMFVLPSRIEALGTSILEASSCGVPCIGSNVGGIPECIKDGVSGFLFERDEIESLKEKISILAQNQDKREEFGKNARALMLEKFSNEAMIRETQRLYCELAQ